MPLCTEKQARASKNINPLMTKLAELGGLQICMSMVQVRPSADLLVPEDKPGIVLLVY